MSGKPSYEDKMNSEDLAEQYSDSDTDEEESY